MISEIEFAQAVDSRSLRPIYEKMKQVHVGIAGLGGLGSNAAAALCRSGVGRLTLVDFDVVELSNINRQLYTLKHLGMKKTLALSQLLHEINPFCQIESFDVRVDESNCAELFSDCDYVCEAFDDAQCKALLVNNLLTVKDGPVIVSGSGMAGTGRSNEIVTRKINNRFYICGDGKTDVADGEGLSASRVIVCAGHQAGKIVELILDR